MQVGVAFVVLEVGFEVAFLGDEASFVPNTVDGPSADVPEFAGGDSERIELGLDFSVVPNGRNEGPLHDLYRPTQLMLTNHVFIVIFT